MNFLLTSLLPKNFHYLYPLPTISLGQAFVRIIVNYAKPVYFNQRKTILLVLSYLRRHNCKLISKSYFIFKSVVYSFMTKFVFITCFSVEVHRKGSPTASRSPRWCRASNDRWWNVSWTSTMSFVRCVIVVNTIVKIWTLVKMSYKNNYFLSISRFH